MSTSKWIFRHAVVGMAYCGFFTLVLGITVLIAGGPMIPFRVWLGFCFFGICIGALVGVCGLKFKNDESFL